MAAVKSIPQVLQGSQTGEGEGRVGGVLLVCTANQIRSPMAERLLVHGLTRKFGPVADSVVVMSSGLRAGVGQPLHPLAAAELELLGVPADGHRSALIDAGVVERAHLVLTATRAQRDEVIAMVPCALTHAFTLRELAWLLDGLGPHDVPGKHLAVRVSRLPEVARPQRGMVVPLAPEAYDIDDPVGGARQDYVRAANEIEAAVTSVLAVL